MAVWDMVRPVQAQGRAQRGQGLGLPATKATKRAVHPEYSAGRQGSLDLLWGGKTDQSAIVVYDDATLKVKKVITDPKMITPTGKFNVTTRNTTSLIDRQFDRAHLRIKGRKAPLSCLQNAQQWGGIHGDGNKRVWASRKRPSAKYSLLTLLVVGFVSGVFLLGRLQYRDGSHQHPGLLHFLPRDAGYGLSGIQTDHPLLEPTGVRPSVPTATCPRIGPTKWLRKIQASQEVYGKIVGTIDTPEKFEAKRLELAEQRMGAHEEGRVAGMPQLPQLRGHERREAKTRAKEDA